MRAWLFLSVVACGHSHSKGPDAPLVDTPQSDSPSPPCVMPTAHDTFDQTPACQTWGYAFIDNAGGIIGVANGQLTIAPGANAGSGASHIGCATIDMQPFGDGAFVQVTTAPSMSEYMEFYAGTAMVEWRPTMLKAYHNDLGTTTPLATTPFDAVATTWVRIHPSADNTAVEIQTSGNGRDWTTFATDPVAPPAMASIELDGGTRMPDPAPPPIVFDSLNVCPP